MLKYFHQSLVHSPNKETLMGSQVHSKEENFSLSLQGILPSLQTVEKQ